VAYFEANEKVEKQGYESPSPPQLINFAFSRMQKEEMEHNYRKPITELQRNRLLLRFMRQKENPLRNRHFLSLVNEDI